MKSKLLTGLLLAAMVTVSAYAVTITNRGQVITIQTLEDTISDTQDLTVVTLQSDGSIIDTNATVDATIYTPMALGQKIVGTVNDDLYVSVGFTTNDWEEVVMDTANTAAILAADTAQSDTNATTDATLYTPRYVGDVLGGLAGSTNTAFIAAGATTNDWVEILR